jgi:hypothetical protein
MPPYRDGGANGRRSHAVYSAVPAHDNGRRSRAAWSALPAQDRIERAGARSAGTSWRTFYSIRAPGRPGARSFLSARRDVLAHVLFYPIANWTHCGQHMRACSWKRRNQRYCPARPSWRAARRVRRCQKQGSASRPVQWICLPFQQQLFDLEERVWKSSCLIERPTRTTPEMGQKK